MWIKALDLEITGKEFASEMITEAGASDMTIVGRVVWRDEELYTL